MEEAPHNICFKLSCEVEHSTHISVCVLQEHGNFQILTAVYC